MAYICSIVTILVTNGVDKNGNPDKRMCLSGFLF